MFPQEENVNTNKEYRLFTISSATDSSYLDPKCGFDLSFEFDDATQHQASSAEHDNSDN